MGKTPEAQSHPPAQSRPGGRSEEGTTGPRRIDQLAQAVDCCIEAKRIAEATGERLLAYLLAMAIQETRSAMRGEVEIRAEVAAAAECGATTPVRETNERRRPSRASTR